MRHNGQISVLPSPNPQTQVLCQASPYRLIAHEVLGQVSLGAFRYSPTSIIPPLFRHRISSTDTRRCRNVAVDSAVKKKISPPLPFRKGRCMPMAAYTTEQKE